MLQKLIVSLLLANVAVLTLAQVPIPHRPLGLVYKNAPSSAPVHIDVFIDLACPDSKAAFPVMKQVADMYTNKTVRLKFLIFPLPYHRNAHLSAIVSSTSSLYLRVVLILLYLHQNLKITQLFEVNLSHMGSSHLMRCKVKSAFIYKTSFQ